RRRRCGWDPVRRCCTMSYPSLLSGVSLLFLSCFFAGLGWLLLAEKIHGSAILLIRAAACPTALHWRSGALLPIRRARWRSFYGRWVPREGFPIKNCRNRALRGISAWGRQVCFQTGGVNLNLTIDLTGWVRNNICSRGGPVR